MKNGVRYRVKRASGTQVENGKTGLLGKQGKEEILPFL
jgi:hypothetical protein